MPKFVKLLLRDKNEGDMIQWRLVIDSEEALQEYYETEAQMNMRAFLDLDRDANNNIVVKEDAPIRSKTLQRLIDLRVNSAPRGTKIHPIAEVAKITDAKYLGMAKALNVCGALQILNLTVSR